jgi:hypothetical protein
MEITLLRKPILGAMDAIIHEIEKIDGNRAG